MIAFRNTAFGVVLAGSFMVSLYVLYWLMDILFLGGDYDPLTLVALPVAACIYGAIAFWIAIFPIAHFCRWIAGRRKMDRFSAAVLTASLCGSSGVIFGGVAGDLVTCVMYAFYAAGGGFIFFITATRKRRAEQ